MRLLVFTEHSQKLKFIYERNATHTHTVQFKIGLIQATGSQIPTVPRVSRHDALF
jgi:hypothetical protein